MRTFVTAVTVVASLIGAADFASAQEAPKLRSDIPPELAKRLQDESDARTGCKKTLCEVARGKKTEASVSCNVTKTWVDIDLKAKILRDRLDWPWGHAQCTSDIKIDGTALAKVAKEAKIDVAVGKHAVVCNLAGKDGKESHKLTFSIDPLVTFDNGKATKAVLKWSDVNGTTLASTAAWSATAVDNSFGVLQGAVIEQINEFLGPKCDETLQ